MRPSVQQRGQAGLPCLAACGNGQRGAHAGGNGLAHRGNWEVGQMIGQSRPTASPSPAAKAQPARPGGVTWALAATAPPLQPAFGTVAQPQPRPSQARGQGPPGPPVWREREVSTRTKGSNTASSARPGPPSSATTTVAPHCARPVPAPVAHTSPHCPPGWRTGGAWPAGAASAPPRCRLRRPHRRRLRGVLDNAPAANPGPVLHAARHFGTAGQPRPPRTSACIAARSPIRRSRRASSLTFSSRSRSRVSGVADRG